MKKSNLLSKAEMKDVLGGLQNPNGCPFDLIKCTCPTSQVYCVSSLESCVAFCTPLEIPKPHL